MLHSPPRSPPSLTSVGEQVKRLQSQVSTVDQIPKHIRQFGIHVSYSRLRMNSLRSMEKPFMVPDHGRGRFHLVWRGARVQHSLVVPTARTIRWVAPTAAREVR